MIRKIGILDSAVRSVSEVTVRDIRVYHFNIARTSGSVGWQAQPTEFFLGSNNVSLVLEC